MNAAKVRALALALGLAAGVATAAWPPLLALAQSDAGPPSQPGPESVDLEAGIARVEHLLAHIDAMIDDQDARLHALGTRIDATPDPDQRRRLEAVALDWTAALDRLEEQRDMLIRLIAELRGAVGAEGSAGP